MKLKQLSQVFWKAIALSITVLTIAMSVLIILPTSVLAAGNQSNQGISQSASLIAPEPNFKISVYPKPSADQRRVGYGMGGDAVTILEQVGSNEGYTWDYVKFDKLPNLEGWVRADFLSLQTPSSHTANSKRSGNSKQMNGDWGDRQSIPQNSYQTQKQQGSSYQKQSKSSFQDKAAAVKETVLDFFKKS